MTDGRERVVVRGSFRLRHSSVPWVMSSGSRALRIRLRHDGGVADFDGEIDTDDGGAIRPGASYLDARVAFHDSGASRFAKPGATFDILLGGREIGHGTINRVLTLS